MARRARVDGGGAPAGDLVALRAPDLVAGGKVEARDEAALLDPNGAKEDDKGAAIEKKDNAFVRVYPIMKEARALPEDLAELITSALEDENWDETQGTFVRGVAETVVVKHNSAVQKRVRDLLQGVGAVESIYSGFGGGLGDGAFGGTGVQGGGFF